MKIIIALLLTITLCFGIKIGKSASNNQDFNSQKFIVNSNGIHTSHYTASSHSLSSFAFDFEKEEEDKKWLLAAVFILCLNFLSSIKPIHFDKSYLSKKITGNTPRFLLLEVFRL